MNHNHHDSRKLAEDMQKALQRDEQTQETQENLEEPQELQYSPFQKTASTWVGDDTQVSIYQNSTQGRDGEYTNNSRKFRKLLGESVAGDFSSREDEDLFAFPALAHRLYTKGVLYQEDSQREWELALRQRERLTRAMAHFGRGVSVTHEDGMIYVTDLSEAYREIGQPGMAENNYAMDGLNSNAELSFFNSLVMVCIRQLQINATEQTDGRRLRFTLPELSDQLELAIEPGSNRNNWYQKLKSNCETLVQYGCLKIIRTEDSKNAISALYEVRPLFNRFVNAKVLEDFQEQVRTYFETAPTGKRTLKVRAQSRSASRPKATPAKQASPQTTTASPKP
ncbi:MAG: DUF4194 domain-containing protein [Limnobacter sp.]|nr:DUF4194 domain-containing protein [Limnobacter sp.]